MKQLIYANLAAIWFIGGILNTLYLGAVKKYESDYFTVLFGWFALWFITMPIRVGANYSVKFFTKIKSYVKKT